MNDPLMRNSAVLVFANKQDMVRPPRQRLRASAGSALRVLLFSTNTPAAFAARGIEAFGAL